MKMKGVGEGVDHVGKDCDEKKEGNGEGQGRLRRHNKQFKSK